MGNFAQTTVVNVSNVTLFQSVRMLFGCDRAKRNWSAAGQI